jgi:hypothetical protein
MNRTKNRGELRFSGRVSSCCSTSDTRRINPVISHEWGKDHQDFLDRGLLLTRKLLHQGFLFVKLKSSLLRSPPWLGWPLWNIGVTNDHGYTRCRTRYEADLYVIVAIVLSFLLRFTDSNYPFGNFKLFLFSEKYIQKHFSSTCIWSIYLSVDTILQSFWFLSGFPW